MKLVFVAFDNVSHQPKSTNMISMTQYSGDYIIDSAYVNNIKSLDTMYNSIKPDVFFIDSSFSKKDILEFLTEFQKKNINDCKLILTYKNKKDKYDFAQTKIPSRFFPYKVPSDILSYSFKELSEGVIFSHNEKIDTVIKDFKLDLTSPITRQFRDCLEILTTDNSKYLLYGYLYNAFYTVSKLEDVILDTIRKSIYKVKDIINTHISLTLMHSIFRDYDISSINLPDFFDYIVEYIEI